MFSEAADLVSVSSDCTDESVESEESSSSPVSSSSGAAVVSFDPAF